MSERASLIHYARVLLHQARAFRLRGSSYSTTLLNRASTARRRAAAYSDQSTEQGPAQLDLFG